jgi:hypothetical protein
MRRILISTVVGDIHATAVAVALQRMGHQPLLWYTSDLPVRASASLHLGGTQPGTECSIDLPNLAESVESIDTYWHRRLGEPVVDVPLAACDRAIAERESQRMVTVVLDALSDSAFAVNGMRAARRAEDKVGQLRLAERLGMLLPATLISNAPEKIRRFLQTHERAGAFAPICWLNGDRAALNFTAKVSCDLLPEDEVLRLTPAIYQAQVPKAFEVRLTCIGAERIAVALHSQQEAHARLDWRGVSPQRLGVRRVPVPVDVARRCDDFLTAMDLRFGCFDFVVTPQGQWVFLEVNQMGQFLWVEEEVPELPLLQMFCELLVQRDPAYRYRRHGQPIGFADVVEEAACLMKEAASEHQQPAKPPFVYAEA